MPAEDLSFERELIFLSVKEKCFSTDFKFVRRFFYILYSNSQTKTSYRFKNEMSFD